MSALYSFYCPHCSRLIEATHCPVSYGNPIKNCPRCGKIYIDSYCTEPALREYKPLSVWHHLKTGILGGPGAAIIVTLIASIVVKDSTVRWIIFGISVPVCTLLDFLWSLRIHNDIEKRRLECWQESDRRLRDPKHAAALKFYGYNVPPKYLPSGYWKDRDTLTYPGAVIESPSHLFKQKNPPPHMPNGTERYY